MKRIDTALPDVFLIEPKVFGDSRGYFYESYNQKVFDEMAGSHVEFVQDNQSRSAKGVLRGLHYQIQQAQGKLIRVMEGAIFDVAVDIRRGSPTFGKSAGFVLSAENKRMAWIPPGFAHGFLVLSDFAEFAYKVTDFYHPGDEGGLAWNDPAIGIEWPELNGEYQGNAHKDGYYMEDGSPLLLSEKDELWLPLKDTFAF